MDELDKKLDGDFLYKVVDLVERDKLDDALWRIKQAFIEAGYSKSPLTAIREEMQIRGMMTGQEWYDRFAKELDDIEMKLVIHNKTATKEEILEAAKKAAGIE